jgi:hypothetical protein
MKTLTALAGGIETKEAGYDEWFKTKVTRSMERAKSDESASRPHAEAFARIETNLKRRFPNFGT